MTEKNQTQSTSTETTTTETPAVIFFFSNGLLFFIPLLSNNIYISPKVFIYIMRKESKI